MVVGQAVGLLVGLGGLHRRDPRSHSVPADHRRRSRAWSARKDVARGRITLALAAIIESLNTQVQEIEEQMSVLLDAHPDQHIFTSLPRSGMVRAASLLAEIGDCRERFPSDDALAALAGASPSTRQSGKRELTVFRWSCNKKLRAAVMDFANGSRATDPWAADVYRRAIARGCRHPHAIRILARAWIRVIWRCWQDGTAFDPSRHATRQLAAA